MASDRESINDRSGDESTLLERIVERFEDAWQHGRRPVLDAYLPNTPGECLPILIELVHIDLEYRAKAGEAVRVENYLERFPVLTRDRSIALELIAAECKLRSRDPSTTLETYLHRFPQYREDLPRFLPTLPVSPPPGKGSTPRPGLSSGPASRPTLPARRIRFPKSLEGPAQG
jgi:hypothetical protein